MPLWILSFFAVFAGFLNVAALRHEVRGVVRAHASPASPTLAHRRRSTDPLAGISSLIAHRRLRRRVRLLLPASCTALEDLIGAQRARRAPASTFLVNKYYLDVLYTDVIVAGIKGPIADGVYWFNQNVIDNVSELHRARARSSLGRFTYDVHRPEGHRRRRQRHRDRHRRSRRRSCARSRPVGCSSTRLILVVAVGLFALRARGSSRKRRGIGSMNWFDSWALTLTVFIPAVGAVDRAAASRAPRRRRSSRSRCSRRSPRFGVDIGDRSPTSTTTTAGVLQFDVEQAVDRRHQQPLPRRHRRHLAADARAVGVHHRAVRHLLVEPLPRAAQPEGVPRADPDPRDRA